MPTEMTTPVVKRCKDCESEGVTTTRKLATKSDGSLQPGPRCVTHWRATKKTRSLAAHAKRTEANFEISGEVYWWLYEMQGGLCFVCRKARGVARRLAVDHDHELALEHGHDPKKGCVGCLRCLACGPCNREVLGRLDVAALCRAIEVLTDPPARKWLSNRQ